MDRALNALLFISGIAFGTIFSAIIVSAWTGPTGTAPNSNVSAPLNVGSTSQTKNGVLGVNGLAVFGDTILGGPNSYLNFGATAGANGYGIRDNTGTLEFKNTGGGWNNFTNSVLNVLGAGAVATLKFSDGTTQTTAAGGVSASKTFSCALSFGTPSCTATCASGYFLTGCTIYIAPGYLAPPQSIPTGGNGGNCFCNSSGSPGTCYAICAK